MKKLISFALILTLSLALFAMLTGCTENATTENDPVETSDAAPTGEAAAPTDEDDDTGQPLPVKDELIIGFTSIPTHFDPLQSGSAGVLLFSSLIAADADMNIVPDLAESWEISNDGMVYTFNLRDDALFTDGTPVKASDVVFSYYTIMNGATSTDLSIVESVAAADDSTIVITLKQPRSVFLLTAAEVYIAPEHLYNDDFGLNPVGSGPFKLEQYNADEQFILTANEAYYAGAPAMKRVVFVKMDSEDVRLAAAQSGQVDITLTSAVTAAGVGEVPGYYLLVEESVDNMGIALPFTLNEGEINEYGAPVGNDVTGDIAVRKALSYGIDRQKICDDALSGFASPAYSENDGMPWSNPENKIDYDLDLAKKYLDDAGWIDEDGDGIRSKDGVRASFALLYFANDSVRQAVAHATAQQARDNLGIEIDVDAAATADFAATMYSTPIILAWGSSNPMTSYYLFHSSNAGKDDWYNPENYRNATVDSYLDQALNAKSLEESYEYWKKAQWDGITGTSLKGDAAYVFLINKKHLYWAREGLNTGRQKIHAHGDAWPLVANLKDWKWEQ
ncbi:MAG: ABC transporter substrate-binding protein [Oscillospiraceae bacterium]|jgi:peptide/nickel transport system substrate-binding protein|nr:ABC transporter substrate-binding protein [Oscillospiraceae bacterium]